MRSKILVEIDWGNGQNVPADGRILVVIGVNWRASSTVRC